MAKSKRKAGEKPARTEGGSRSSVRDGGKSLTVRNSGLEVWLYDDANREVIRSTGAPDSGFGGMPPGFGELTRQGIVVGYSLVQDDDLHVAVYVGAPLTEPELSAARWLEPQRAFLRLPSGRLCVESNDASRIGPEEPNEAGGVVDVPGGDYVMTLYRIDHEALDRERLKWSGPQEVIVLTPGGSPADAAQDLLPFEPRRDTSWVGKYTINGKSADALAWFSDYWDTCVLNLDSGAAEPLGLVPGSYLRTRVPAAGITLVSAFAGSWDEAKRLAPPSGVDLSEYGYAAFCPMADWNGAEALFCRRDTTKTRVEDEHHNVWLPALVEVLDVRPQAQAAAGKVLAPTELRTKNYFDSGFLALILSDVLPEVGDLEELELSDALDRIDKKLTKMGLAPQGDVSWTDLVGAVSTEFSCRLYAGLPNCFGAVLAGEGRFELVFVSELGDETWIVTGLADDLEGRIASKGPGGLPVPHPRVALQSMDESLAKMFSAHKASLRKPKSAPVAAPTDFKEAVAALERFLTVALG